MPAQRGRNASPEAKKCHPGGQKNVSLRAKNVILGAKKMSAYGVKHPVLGAKMSPLGAKRVSLGGKNVIWGARKAKMPSEGVHRAFRAGVFPLPQPGLALIKMLAN